MRRSLGYALEYVASLYSHPPSPLDGPISSQCHLDQKLTCAAQFLSQFDTILVVDNGTIAHKGTYEELLSSGILDEEAFSCFGSSAPKAPSIAKDAVEVTSDGKVVLKNAKLNDEETETRRAPSDWSVYAYFLKSCGTAGIVLFFGLAAVLAAERSFESKFAGCGDCLWPKKVANEW